MNEIQDLSPLSPAQARHIDEACDRFEAAWKAGRRPDLKEHLGTAVEPVRSALLRQLLLLDWDYARRAGEEPASGHYLSWFPGDSTLIEEVGHAMIETPPSTYPGPRNADATPSTWSPEDAASVDQDSEPQSAAAASRYELLQEVGRGGIGVVFRGRDGLLRRELAVKVLHDTHVDNPDARRRFVAEARICSHLQHPAIVPVYELGWFSQRRPFFTMKLVQGHTLAALLKDRSDPEQDQPRLLGVFAQVCQAMAYAHSRGVVHRDLKPANVMVGAFGEVQVMDWGFAKILTEDGPDDGVAFAQDANGASDSHGSQSGMLMGTPAYMPPEQARGEADHIDRRADVFALGAILCEVLTGKPPYLGDSADEVCRQAADGELGNAHSRLRACTADAALRELALRCLAAERQARPADAGVVAQGVMDHLARAEERLRQAQLARAAAEARAQEAGAKARAERRARRSTLALAGAAVVLVAAAAAGWWWRDHVQRTRAHQVAATDDKIEAALAEAADWRDRRDWPQARAAATRARELLDSGGSDQWRERADELSADLDIVAEIEDIRLLQSIYDHTIRSYAHEKALPRYAQAFARYGVAVGASPAEVAARITQRPAAVRDVLIVGLDNWWLIARNRDRDTHAWLDTLLPAVDNDDWRAQVRRAVAQGNRRGLEELAAKEDIARQPSATSTSLTWALLDLGAHDAAIALLRPAQQRSPNDLWINLDLGRALAERQPPNHAEALRFFSIARALRPEMRIHVNLGYLHARIRDWDGVVAVSRKALEQNLDPVERARAYTNLGTGLGGNGEWQQAQEAYRKALELDPKQPEAHHNLGLSLKNHSQADQALVEFEQAIRLVPEAALAADTASSRKLRRELADAHFCVAGIRHAQKDFPAALAAYDKAIELDPNHVGAHHDRGALFLDQGRFDDAIAEFEQALRLEPRLARGWMSLGDAWLRKDRPERAAAAIAKAVALSPSARNHYNLGVARQKAEDWQGALDSYREAVRLDPNLAEAQCRLGVRLEAIGQFAEAVAAFQRGHELKAPGWPTENWLKAARRKVELDAKLPGILDGSAQPATAWERLEYGWVCKLKGLFGASARFYADAFLTDPKLASALEQEHRYQAACIAAQAGTGRGNDLPELDAAERARWRQQALDWLRADLALWKDQVDSAPNKRSSVVKALQSWQKDETLAGIREPQQLAKLPEPERAPCLRLWADVSELLVQCLASAPEK